MQCNLIQELFPSEFDLGHNAMEVTKNICYTKSEGVVDYSSDCKTLD